MIDIQKKEDCVGCGACVQRCPEQCIEMREDEQGFLYPEVDRSRCIDCHLCERVCPVINQAAPRRPQAVYAAKNPDEAVRLASSSGGVFFALAKGVIEQGGVVFGARFDESWNVVHSWAETLDGVRAFQGSKYVQSRMDDAYRQAESFLKAGRKVMFTGTPCQIAGLRLFLRRDYGGGQLLTVDVVCHGVPSPLVWREYLRHITTRPQGASAGKNTVSGLSSNSPMPVAVTGISFRDKRLGWEKFGFRLSSVAREGDRNSVSDSCKTSSVGKATEFFEPMGENLYMQAFLKDLDLRPSCYACPAKCGKAGSDITLADFWGIDTVLPDKDNRKGVSLILIHTEHGRQVFAASGVRHVAASYADALRGNRSIECSVARPRNYETFWREFDSRGIAGVAGLLRRLRPTLARRILRRIINHIPPRLRRCLRGLRKT